MVASSTTTRADPPPPGAFATCTHTGSVRAVPGVAGMGIFPHDIPFTFSSNIACTLADGSTMHGVETATGLAPGATCALRVNGSGSSVINWDNGAKTYISYAFLGVGMMVSDEGSRVTKGQWSGSWVNGYHMLQNFNMLDCATPLGVRDADYSGTITFGIP